MSIHVCYEACPTCMSPEIEDSGDYYKCVACGDIFDFPEEIPISEDNCPQCYNLNINVKEVYPDGSCRFYCPHCGCDWDECRDEF